MDVTAIKKTVDEISPLEPEAWETFESYFSVRTLKKGEKLWNIGDVCKQVIFINKGLIRFFYYSEEEGKEITSQFMFENVFLTDYYSFITQQPCFAAYEALEETHLISIPRAAIYNLYEKYISAERLGRIIAEQNFLGLLNTHMNLKNVSPEEKYLRLIKERPNVMARVPLNLIASYLGITPEHLSRIRKKVVRA